MQSIERLLKTGVQLTACALLGPSLSGCPCPELLPVLLQPILDLLDSSAAVSASVRTEALQLVRVLIFCMRDRTLVADPAEVLFLFFSILQSFPRLALPTCCALCWRVNFMSSLSCATR